MNKKDICKITLAAITTLLCAACTSDELADGNPLPKGEYPLVINTVNVTGDVQTRVSESSDGAKSVWDGGEIFAVKLEGTSGTGTYKIEAGDSTSVVTQTYWSKTTDNITAWYPATSTIDLTDQSTKLAYAMKATISSASYKSAVNLEFKHQLAKIRVLLTGTTDMQGGTVQVKGYTTGNIDSDNGKLTGSGEMGWITMKKCSYSDGSICYEANVIPGVELLKEAFQVTAQNEKPTVLNLNAPVSIPEDGGKIHEITLTVNNQGTMTVDLTNSSTVYSNNTYTVPCNASMVLDGKGQALDKCLVINSGARVVLKDVILHSPASCNYGMIAIYGDATLILSGTNEIKGSKRGAIVVENGTLTIEGTTKDKLNVTTYNHMKAGCICACPGGNIVINGGNISAIADGTQGAGIGTFGNAPQEADPSVNITINGGKVYARGGGEAAGIGCCRQDIPNYNMIGNIGNIVITGGNVTAIGGGKEGSENGAGIGAGANGKFGDITISGANTVVYAECGAGGSADDIGVGASSPLCGTVTITAKNVTAAHGWIKQ